MMTNRTALAVSVLLLPALVWAEQYTEVEYVQATHEQYINTEYYPNDKTTIYLKFAADDYMASRTDGTSATLASRDNIYILACYDDRCQFAYGNKWFLGFGRAYNNSGGMTKDTDVHEMGLTNGTFYIDGVKKYESTDKTMAPSHGKQAVLTVFALNTNGTPKYWCAAKVYSLIISEEGKEKRHFVPAKNSAGVPGLYDTVGGGFYKSATTTPLVAGNDVRPILDEPKLLDVAVGGSVAKGVWERVTVCAGADCQTTVEAYMGTDTASWSPIASWSHTVDSAVYAATNTAVSGGLTYYCAFKASYNDGEKTVVKWSETNAVELIAIPEGWNAWVAEASGLASDAANWSSGVPKSGDKVLFDGTISSADCEWNAGVNGLASTLGAWKQSENYTGKVTVDTTFDTYATDFTNLVVTGDVAINGGILQQKTHGTETAAQYRLMMTVGGDFTVGADATVSVAGLGRYSSSSSNKSCPWGGSAAHGGDNASGETAQFNENDPAYGDILAPMAVAHGSQSGTDSNDKKSHGGGALCLVVAGDFTNNGVVTADGEGNYSACGAGGSIYITAANIYGAGKYTASVPAMGKSDGTGAVGSGGRIALVAAGVNQASDVICKGRREGWGRCGAPGTVYLKGSAVDKIVVMADETPNWNANSVTTPIPSESDSMDWKTCARNIDLVGDCYAHLRITQPVVKMKSLSLLSAAKNRKSGNSTYFHQSDLDLAGNILQVGAVIVDGVDLRLSAGDYTLAYAEAQGWTWLKDSSHQDAVAELTVEVPGTGVLRIVRDGMMLYLR